MELYLHCNSDFSISDETEKQYTVAEARAALEAGNVTDFNLGFKRLIQNNFDLDAVKAYFIQQR